MARPPAIQIRSVVTKACDFEGLAIDEDQDHAELRADGNRFGKNPLYVFGSRASGDIVILRWFFEQHVAHAAAGKEGFKTLLAKALDDKNSFFTR